MAVATLSAKQPVVNVTAAVAGDAVFRCLWFSFGFCPVAVVTAQFLVGAIDLEIGRFIMIEKPGVPRVRVVT